LTTAGAVPIPGAKNVAQVAEHVGALGWELEDNEVAIIDEKFVALKL
jgi:aryl-alcohol dehydrogenase-like predicted oxidoreductase